MFQVKLSSLFSSMRVFRRPPDPCWFFKDWHFNLAWSSETLKKGSRNYNIYSTLASIMYIKIVKMLIVVCKSAFVHCLCISFTCSQNSSTFSLLIKSKKKQCNQCDKLGVFLIFLTLQTRKQAWNSLMGYLASSGDISDCLGRPFFVIHAYQRVFGGACYDAIRRLNQ